MSWTGTEPDQPGTMCPGLTVIFGWGYTHDGRADKDSYPHDRRADSHCRDFFVAVCVPCPLGSFVQKLLEVSLDRAKCRLVIIIHSFKDR